MKHSDIVSLAAEQQCKAEAEPDPDAVTQTMRGFPNDGSDICAWMRQVVLPTPLSMHLQDRFSDFSRWTNQVSVILPFNSSAAKAC